MQITILKSKNGGELRKRIAPDGNEVEGHYAISEFWSGTTLNIDVHGLFHLYRRRGEVIPGLIDRPDEILCLGHPTEPKWNTTRKNWVAAPSDVILIDGDGIPYPDGFSDATLIERPLETIRAVLESIGLGGRLSLVVLSSKAGLTATFRAHIFVQLAAHYTFEQLNDHLKSKQASWIDPIMQPARLLFSSRPMLEQEHLPERVFLIDGTPGILPVESAESMVKLTKMASRGVSGLYRLNEGRIHANEWVTEECWNFILSCKRARMSEDEAVDALRVEFLRLNGAPAVWKKMWKPMKNEDTDTKLDPVLGDARRMYRDMHGGTGTIYGQPAYTEPETTLDDAVREMRRAIVDQVGREGIFLNKVSLGVGKTHEIVDYATRHDKKVLILAPNHERCDEIVDRLEAARQRRLHDLISDYGVMDTIENDGWIFRHWETWRGRSAEGMCKRLPVVEQAFRVGVNVFQNVCGFPTPNNANPAQCPHFSQCRYAKQVMDFWRSNWVVPVAMISQLSRLAGEADLVIVDEGCVDYLAGQRTVDLEELIAPRNERLDALSRRAYLDLLDGERRIKFDELQEALDLDLELRKVPDVEPDMDDDEILSRCDVGRYRPGAVSIWRALIAEHAGGENHLHVYHFEEEVDGKKVARWRVEVSWRREAKLLSQVKTVLLFDATPNETALRAHFPDLETFEFAAPFQNTHTVQVYDASGKRSSLLADAKADKKTRKAYKKRRAVMADWLRAQPGHTVVVTKKEYREKMEKEQEFARVAFAHFGAVEGKDIWEFPDGARLKGAEVDNLVIIGRSAPRPWVMESEARKHHCDEGAIAQMCKWYDERHVELAAGIAGTMPVHKDPRVDAVFRAVWKNTQMQAVGRGRSVRREKRLRLFILHNMPLDVSVAEVVSGAQLMRRVGDVTLLSPKEVERVFGAGGRSTERLGVEPTHKYWREERQTQPYRCAVAVGTDIAAAMEAVGAIRWEAV
jgi:hypothetical protein